MRKRTHFGKWFFTFANKARSRTPRRLPLERLEARYVLTGPVAHDDHFFADFASPPNAIQLPVIDGSFGPTGQVHDEPSSGRLFSELHIVEANDAPVPAGGGTIAVTPEGTLSLESNLHVFDFTPGGPSATYPFGFTG